MAVMPTYFRRYRLCLWVTGMAMLTAATAAAGQASREVEFGREIRPILSNTCYQCHGPDKETRQADFRLDLKEQALARLDGGEFAIVPGHPEQSELYRRITAADPDERMPPVDSGKHLTKEQVELIRRWIEQGAHWDQHWAFVPPKPLTPPQVHNEAWIRNEIDRFVLKRLEGEGLTPSPEADKRRLIRRVTLDLTGLPPTPDEVQAFLADESASAYETLVDRLLNSPRYGERMAIQWLDAARYADTHGYIFDTERDMWRYREWVINAFNRNMPFDEFTIEQLAGDLLPNPTLDQRIASGFNRNHVINGEFGAIAEEYLVENICDRVNTTSMVWMGLTMECARCHDHKYDPILQKDFYELYAFFDSIPESGLDGLFGNAGPAIQAPTADQSDRLQQLNVEIEQAESVMKVLRPEIDRAQSEWEAAHHENVQDVRWGLIGYWPFDHHANDVSQAAGNANANNDAPIYGGGIFAGAAAFFGLNSLKAERSGQLDTSDPFTLSAWINPLETDKYRAVFSRMAESVTFSPGYSMHLHDGALSLVLVHQFPDSMINVESESTIKSHEWHHVLATYDGSGKAPGVKLYVDGRRQKVRILENSLSGSINVNQPLQFGTGNPGAIFKGQIDEARIYNRVVSDSEIAGLPEMMTAWILAVPPKNRNADQARRIREYYLTHDAPRQWSDAYFTLARLTDTREAFRRNLPTVMVMQEKKQPTETRILGRGAYDKPGEKVSPGTPGFLPPMKDNLPRNRLGLARWLVDPGHPLTARVAVNGYWQMYFGAGLVKTSEDFGSQGTPPSHPELLDWLAVEFIQSGWNVKAMQRLIVTSATYRQSSRIPPDLMDRDPENRLLARGPRFRLPAEFIRDQALAISGLLVEKIGGPSVKPYQPPGLWKEGAFDPTGGKWSAQVYEQDEGENLYRRSMYTFWKRTAPPPAMLVFDAPERERCILRRARTNTPLQALVLMNDPTYVEASRKLAERMMTEGGSQPADRIRFAFRLACAREPSTAELQTLMTLFEKQSARFAGNPDAALKLISVGESPRNATLDVRELAAYSTIASVIFDLDETLTKS